MGLGVRGKERVKEKEKFLKKKGKEQAQITLSYSKLNILTVIKNNGLYTERLVKNFTH